MNKMYRFWSVITDNPIKTSFVLLFVIVMLFFLYHIALLFLPQNVMKNFTHYYDIELRENNGEVKELRKPFFMQKSKIKNKTDKVLEKFQKIRELTPSEDEFKINTKNINDLIFMSLTYPNNSGLNYMSSYANDVINDLYNVPFFTLLEQSQCNLDSMLCHYHKILYLIHVMQNFNQHCNMALLTPKIQGTIYDSIYFVTYSNHYNVNDILHLKLSRAWSEFRDLAFDSVKCFQKND